LRKVKKNFGGFNSATGKKKRGEKTSGERERQSVSPGTTKSHNGVKGEPSQHSDASRKEEKRMGKKKSDKKRRRGKSFAQGRKGGGRNGLSGLFSRGRGKNRGGGAWGRDERLDVASLKAGT